MPNKHQFNIVPWLAALIFIGAPAVGAQQTNDLQQQVKQLKQEYEQEIADLKRRLAALERKAAEQETKAPSAEKYSVTARQAAQEIAKPVEGNRDQNVKRLQEQTT